MTNALGFCLSLHVVIGCIVSPPIPQNVIFVNEIVAGVINLLRGSHNGIKWVHHPIYSWCPYEEKCHMKKQTHTQGEHHIKDEDRDWGWFFYKPRKISNCQQTIVSKQEA